MNSDFYLNPVKGRKNRDDVRVLGFFGVFCFDFVFHSGPTDVHVK